MQDRAITQIGVLSKASFSHQEPYQFYVENMFPGREYLMLLGVFEIDIQENRFQASFQGPDLNKVGETTYARYLYRKGSSRGGDITLTTKAGDLAKKLRNFFRPQLAAAYELAKTSQDTQEIGVLSALQALIDTDFANIQQQMAEAYAQIDKKEQQTTGFSIQFLIRGEKKHLEDFAVFRKQVLNHGVLGKKEKYNLHSSAEHQLCSICLTKKEEVMGFASPFKFATVDKPGMVAGFFQQKNNWKNYPICGDCALDFELGQKYVFQHLKKTFYGLSYFLIPKTILPGDQKSLQMALKILQDIDFQLSVKQGETIRRKEDKLMEKLGSSENFYSLSLLFFEENQTTKAMSIKLLLEEIMPSRFRKLFIDAAETINKFPWYKDLPGAKKTKYTIQFSFGLVKEFFGDDFYGITQTIFKGEKISLERMWSRFMTVIRAYYAEEKLSEATILKAHLLLRYFAYLNIIPIHPISSPMEPNNQEMNPSTKPQKKSFDRAQLEAFIAENPEFFDQTYKQGVFAVGILVRLLLNVQYAAMNNSTPFEKKLQGLNLNHESLTTIYVEALNKLSQFTYKDTNFFIQVYKSLREFINDHFTLQSHQLSRVSNNELSFYFVAGMEMGNRFKIDIEVEDVDA